MKKCILFLCVLGCAMAYAGDVKKDSKVRLSTGKKVNSALDNPSSYYSKAQSLKKQKNDSTMFSKQKIQGDTFNPFTQILKK